MFFIKQTRVLIRIFRRVVHNVVLQGSVSKENLVNYYFYDKQLLFHNIRSIVNTQRLIQVCLSNNIYSVLYPLQTFVLLTTYFIRGTLPIPSLFSYRVENHSVFDYLDFQLNISNRNPLSFHNIEFAIMTVLTVSLFAFVQFTSFIRIMLILIWHSYSFLTILLLSSILYYWFQLPIEVLKVTGKNSNTCIFAL